MKSPLGSVLALLLTAAVVLPLFSAAQGMEGRVQTTPNSNFQGIAAEY
jgi:hypothetical protein